MSFLRRQRMSYFIDLPYFGNHNLQGGPGSISYRNTRMHIFQVWTSASKAIETRDLQQLAEIKSESTYLTRVGAALDAARLRDQ
jgi:hypothetical protein